MAADSVGQNWTFDVHPRNLLKDEGDLMAPSGSMEAPADERELGRMASSLEDHTLPRIRSLAERLNRALERLGMPVDPDEFHSVTEVCERKAGHLCALSRFSAGAELALSEANILMERIEQLI